MKFRTLIFLLLTLSFLAPLFAQETEVMGSGSYGTESLDSLEGNGLVKLDGTSIANLLRVMGSLIAKDAQIGTLDVMGEANLRNTTVKNGATIMGSCQASSCTFEQMIHIHMQKVLFTACKTKGISVHKDGGFKGRQIVELKQGTVIDGPIHFDSGKGEVVIFPGCKVTGPVTGGKIVKKI